MNKKLLMALLSLTVVMAPSVSAENAETGETEENTEVIVVLDDETEDAADDEAVEASTETETEAAEPDTEIETETETETEAVPVEVSMTTAEFVEDIAKSYNQRSVIAAQYTEEEKSTMAMEDLAAHLEECVSAETWFTEKYQYAVFEDMNSQYLCDTYVSGIAHQLEACTSYSESQDEEHFWELWNEGYYERRYVILEMDDYYEVAFNDVSGMREATAAEEESQTEAVYLGELGAINENMAMSTVLKVQEMLNELGFDCGTADGFPGRKTENSIKNFQAMYGYAPQDGFIDDELLEQLREAVAEKQS